LEVNFDGESTASKSSSATRPAKVVPLLQRVVGPIELTRVTQVRQIVGERLRANEPVSAIVVMANADGSLIANFVGVAPTLMAAMRDELHYLSRRLDDELREHMAAHHSANVHQLRIVRSELSHG